MNRFKIHIGLLAGILIMLTSCGDDEYHYPSVKREFVTVFSDVDGYIETLLPDNENPLEVTNDRTNSLIPPKTYKRVMCNYETVSNGKDSTAVIYSLQSLFIAEPKRPDDPSFGGLLKRDPVELVSFWPGRNYVNVILNVKTNINSGKKQLFDVVEESVTPEGKKVKVKLFLYHNINGDDEYYNRQVYMSIPLIKYGTADNELPLVDVVFEYTTTSASGQIATATNDCKVQLQKISRMN